MIFFLDLTSRRHEVDGKYGTTAGLGDLSLTMLGSATSPLLKATINSNGKKISDMLQDLSRKHEESWSPFGSGTFPRANGSKEG